MDIPTFIDALRTRFADMDDEEREAVLVEIRDHLDEESELLRNRSPGLDKQTAVEQAIQAFGDPHDISLVLDNANDLISVVDNRTGEQLLDVPTLSGSPRGKVLSSTARAVRAIIKYRGFNILGILGLAAILLAVATVIDQPDQSVQSDDVDEPLYQYHHAWTSEDPNTQTVWETMDVDDSIASWTLALDVEADAGCVQVMVRSLGGTVEHDSGSVCDGGVYAEDLQFTESGEFTVEYHYTDFVGSVHLDAWPDA